MPTRVVHSDFKPSVQKKTPEHSKRADGFEHLGKGVIDAQMGVNRQHALHTYLRDEFMQQRVSTERHEGK